MEIVANWFSYMQSLKTSGFPILGFVGNKGDLDIQAKFLMGNESYLKRLVSGS